MNNIIELISAAIMLMLCATVVFMLIRNKMVARFRLMIIQEDFDTTMENISNHVFEPVRNYEKLPSYQRMVWSFKPLKKKYWI